MSKDKIGIQSEMIKFIWELKSEWTWELNV